MQVSPRLPLSTMVDLCRSLRYSLGSGLMLRDVMELLSTKGTRRIRPIADQILKDLKSGWGLQEALQKQKGVFPPLFLALAAVGEESGNLPEVMKELEVYFVMQQKLHREFRQQIRWPMMQLLAGILIIAGLIYILGIIQISRPKEGGPIDPLGLGLMGTQGALTFLGLAFGAALILGIGYQILRRMLRRRPAVDRMLLHAPLIGPCRMAMVLTRVSLALHLMLETSSAVVKTFRLAFMATDNAAFIDAAPKVEESLRQGNSIATSLTATNMFPEQFLSTVAIAEEAGRLPEVLGHVAAEYEEETARRLAVLNQVASWVVWVTVAFLIIMAIFRIFMSVYLNQLTALMPQQ